MSEPETGQQWDAPNQQVVRADGSAPWDEGTGGSGGTAAPHVQTQAADLATIDGWTKEELLAYAQEIGVKPANAAMNKDELRAGIDAKLQEG